MNENEKVILEEILENTKTVKTVVVDKFAKKQKGEKEKSAKAKAEAKFKMIGAKCNQELQAKINERLEELGVNTNSYIKSLIEADLNGLNNKASEDIKEKLEDCKKAYLDKKEKLKEMQTNPFIMDISQTALWKIIALKIPLSFILTLKWFDKLKKKS